MILEGTRRRAVEGGMQSGNVGAGTLLSDLSETGPPTSTENDHTPVEFIRSKSSREMLPRNRGEKNSPLERRRNLILGVGRETLPRRRSDSDREPVRALPLLLLHAGPSVGATPEDPKKFGQLFSISLARVRERAHTKPHVVADPRPCAC